MGQVIAKLSQIPDVPTYPGAVKYLRVAADGTLSWEDAGVSDHGALGGLGDDDHTQYLPKAGGTMTGALLLPDGTLGAPALAFAADRNVGVHRCGNDQFSVVAGGVKRFNVYTGGTETYGAAWIQDGITVYGGEVTITEDVATNVPLTVKGAAAQTANLQEWRYSTGTVLARVTNAGVIESQAYGRFVAGLRMGSGDPFYISEGALGGWHWELKSGGAVCLGINSGAKLGFYSATPVARAAHIADPSGGGTQDAEARSAINAILVALENVGLLAAS